MVAFTLPCGLQHEESTHKGLYGKHLRLVHRVPCVLIILLHCRSVIERPQENASARNINQLQLYGDGLLLLEREIKRGMVDYNCVLPVESYLVGSGEEY